MATTSENLLALAEAKANIKQAIENKGQDLTDVPFTQYHEKIEDIKSNPVLQEKSIQATSSNFEVSPDEGYDGLSKVTVNCDLRRVRIAPQKTETTTSPPAGILGYNEVVVHAVTSSVDSNIIPENIKPGVTILGVTGNWDKSEIAETMISTALNTEV